MGARRPNISVIEALLFMDTPIPMGDLLEGHLVGVNPWTFHCKTFAEVLGD
jgi:hypothetical protein